MVRPCLQACACLVLAAASVAACRSNDKGNPPIGSASAAVATTPPDAGRAAVQRQPPVLITTWGKDVGLKSPESVVHDTEADVYLVSNVDGEPLAADKKAFISRLKPEAMGFELKWIESGKKNVVLNAPKGMALTSDTLWVADIDTVRLFNRKTGAPAGEVKIEGATALNDVVVKPDGTILVSDSGENDAIYAIDKDRKVSPLAKGATLKKPNGLAFVGDKLWVVTFGANEIYTFRPSGEPGQPERLPRGKLDGIVELPDGGDVLISSWDAKTVYRGRPGQAFNPEIEYVTSPADMTFDEQRQRLIVPLFEEDEIRAYAIK